MAAFVGFTEAESKYMISLLGKIEKEDKTALAWMLEAYRLGDSYIKICPAVDLCVNQDLIRFCGRSNPDILVACIDVFIKKYPGRRKESLKHQMWYWHVRALREGWIDIVGMLWLAHVISQQGIATLPYINLTASDYGLLTLKWGSVHRFPGLPAGALRGLVEQSPGLRSRELKAAAAKVKNILAFEVWNPFSVS